MLKFINGGIRLIDRLVSFGDSCIFGSELKDVKDDYTPSKSTYPAIVANELGLEYLCLAKPGASNQYIVKTLLEYPFRGTEVVLIQWTSPSRFGIPLTKGWTDLSPNLNHMNEAKTLSEELYRNVEIDQFSTFQFMLCISTAIQKVICPLIMTSNDLVPYADDKITKFDGKDFLEFSNSYPHGIGGHPLEEAHVQCAEQINTHIQELISR